MKLTRYLTPWMSVATFVAAAACSSPGEGGGSAGAVESTSSALTGTEDCMVGTVDGKIGICHATSSGTSPYVYIRVSTNACISGHQTHAGDFVSDDPTCPVCGNGVVENGEQCDDGNTVPGDGCSATCRTECQPVNTIQRLVFYYLACSSADAAEPQDVVFWHAMAGEPDVEVARVRLPPYDCDTTWRSVEVTDPALLALGKNGVNIFRVTTTGMISWATVGVDTPAGGGETPIWAAWAGSAWGEATSHPGNLCEAGRFQIGLEGSGVAMQLSGGVPCPP